MRTFIRNHPFGVGGATIVFLAGLAWLAIGFFGVHTLFIDDVVDEAGPVFDAPVTTAADAQPVEVATPRTADTEPPRPAATAPGDTAPGDTAPGETAPAVVPEPIEPSPPEIVTEHVGSFVDGSHPTAGDALVLGNGTGQRFLRFENFATDNGPDLNVYLVDSSTGDVSDYVDLGDLSGNVGDQNYEIPTDVDLAVYDQVVIWCVRFGVEFGRADLTPT